MAFDKTTPARIPSDIEKKYVTLLESQQKADQQKIDNPDERFISPLESQLLEGLEKQRLLAIKDGLTQVYNRGYLEEQIGVFQRNRHDISSATVILFDLDDMKGINDSKEPNPDLGNLIGHAAGDEALRRIAKIAWEHARGGDVVARYGGDEFAELLPNINDQTTAEEITNRLQKSFDETSIKVTVGHGTVIRQDDGNLDLEKAFKEADAELYRKKNLRLLK